MTDKRPSMSDAARVAAQPAQPAGAAPPSAEAAPALPARKSFVKSTHPQANYERVRDFMVEWSGPERSASIRCSFFSVFHVTDDGERESIDLVEVGTVKGGKDGKDAERDAERVKRCEAGARTLIDRAKNWMDATMNGRAQKFTVCCYTSANVDGLPLGSVPFQLEAEGGLAVGMTESEAASPTGALAQSMRWSENFGRMMVQTLDRQAERYDRLLDRAFDRLEAAEDRNVALVEQREKLLDRDAERKVFLLKERLGIERTERLYKAIESFGLPLIAKWLGAEQTHPLVEFLHGLSQEEMFAMAATLPEKKQAELAEVLKKMHAQTGAPLQLRSSNPQTTAPANGTKG